MEIKIDREELFNELFMLSEYVADNGGNYKNGAIIDENRELLDVWWSESCSNMLMLLRYWLVVFDRYDGDDFNIEINLVNNELTQQDNIKTLIKTILLNEILSRWLIMTGSEQSVIYSALADAKIKELINIVYFRKPVSYEEN
ncbi:MAG: hypothetical protein R3Y22_04585 [Bacteroidales bacterium]